MSLEKSDQHDQWYVLNLLTYNFGMKDNFEQGGIVPLILASSVGVIPTPTKLSVLSLWSIWHIVSFFAWPPKHVSCDVISKVIQAKMGYVAVQGCGVGVGAGVGVGRSRLFSPESESESESTKFTDSDRLRASTYFTEIAMLII